MSRRSRRRWATAAVSAVLAAAALALGLAAPAGAARVAAPAPAHTPRVLAIHFDAEVNPVTEGFVKSRIRRAAKQGYDAVAILLDTPGGLSESMRHIVQAELASPIPVIVYVTPSGARAASAGVWIGQAADLLAMAPSTNIGSSTPINGNGSNLGSDLRRKVINDSAASLRGLAKSHGRNAAWADKAVRVASNLTADEALRQHVVDRVAPSFADLLRSTDGYKTVPRGFTLHLAGATVDETRMGFFSRFLNTLIDPNILSLLFILGVAGIGFEVFHPGVVVPGVVGAVALAISLFGVSVLPVSWAGFLLFALGAVLLVADLHVVSHGALTAGGLASLAVGAVLLFHDAPAPYHVSVPLVVTVTVLIGGFWAFALSRSWKARRMPVTTGAEELRGEVGVVKPGGLVLVHGELWQARRADGGALRVGDRVAVDALDDRLRLTVHPLDEGAPAGPPPAPPSAGPGAPSGPAPADPPSPALG